jgi:hypothetical protein
MRREYVDRVAEYYLCPLCLFGSSGWDEIEDHLEKDHTDEEAVEQLGLDFIPPTREEDPGWWFDKERKEREENEN